MKIETFLTEDTIGLRIVATVPDRKLESDMIFSISKSEIIAIAEQEYPGYKFVSGPRKLTNKDSNKQVATWVFKMDDALAEEIRRHNEPAPEPEPESPPPTKPKTTAKRTTRTRKKST